MMPGSRFSLAIPIAATMLVVAACQATAPPTSQPTQRSVSTPGSLQPPPPPAPPTTEPTSVPTPRSTIVAPVTASPAATATSSAIDGVYETSFTKDDLASSPLLYDVGEVNDENWGDWTLFFDGNQVEYTQHNDVTSSGAAGAFSIADDVVTLAFDSGANAGETFTMRWQLAGNQLTLSRDGSLKFPGPTPFILKPWIQRQPGSISTLASGGTIFPGTYRTVFDPGFTVTIGDVVDLDCSPGYRCRGDIDVNQENWVGFEFGNVHGLELNVSRQDQVFDPGSPGTNIDPPADLASWLVAFPDLVVLEAPGAVTIGGVTGTQLDVQSPHDLGLGPNAGFAAGHRTRVILLRVAGHVIMITEQLAADNTVGDFGAVTRGLQPVVDSIQWTSSD